MNRAKDRRKDTTIKLAPWEIDQAKLELTEMTLKVAKALGVPDGLVRGKSTGLAEANARYIAMALAAGMNRNWPRRMIADHFERYESDVSFALRHVTKAILLRRESDLHRDTLAICKLFKRQTTVITCAK